jgi:flagellar biogenesis protein FliO
VEIARQILAIAFVLALLGAACWALRRGIGPFHTLRGGKPSRRTLESVERIVLTPQHSLHVVRSGGEEWILATHPQGCSVIQKNGPPGAAA